MKVMKTLSNKIMTLNLLYVHPCLGHQCWNWTSKPIKTEYNVVYESCTTSICKKILWQSFCFEKTIFSSSDHLIISKCVGNTFYINQEANIEESKTFCYSEDRQNIIMIPCWWCMTWIWSLFSQSQWFPSYHSSIALDSSTQFVWGGQGPPEGTATAKTLKYLVGKVYKLEKKTSSNQSQPPRGRRRYGFKGHRRPQQFLRQFLNNSSGGSCAKN